MNGIIFKLWGVINSQNRDSTNYKIAENLLSLTANVGDTSSDALAHTCNVSKASISRFAKELGYTDYFRFRSDLENMGHNDVKADGYNGVKSIDIGTVYLNNYADNMKLMMENVNEQDLEEIAITIAKRDKVFLFGNMQSGNTAENLQYNLFCCYKMTQSASDIAEQIDIIKTLRGEEAVILFSVSGRAYQELFENDPELKIPHNTKVYMLTTNPEIEHINGIKIINAGTGWDISAGTNSIQMMTDIIFLKYLHYIQQ